jgi:N-methylhydantoinase A
MPLKSDVNRFELAKNNSCFSTCRLDGKPNERRRFWFMKRIAVDIGGTFTDIVCIDDDTAEVVTDKVRSTPSDIARAVFEAIKKIAVDMAGVGLFVHGTTVGLNTVVRKKGAKVGLITTEGFTDVLEMARGNRKELYGYL